MNSVIKIHRERLVLVKKICVIGSLNIDLVASVDYLPKAGETILGNSFGKYFGGKGANQVVQIAKLGNKVSMVGMLGDDDLGDSYKSYLEEEGVETSCIGRANNCSSGTAIIEVDAKGENRIIVIAGANGKVDRSYVDDRWDSISAYDIYLLQLEIPLDTSLYLIKKLSESGKTIILDPAPARELPCEIYKYIDFITPNETEMEVLSGLSIENERDLKIASKTLLKMGVKNIIAKSGARGAYIINDLQFERIDGYKVETVDTVAAGDSFNAGFAYKLSKGFEVRECIRFANAVAAISTTGRGAQEAMASIDEVKAYLE